jgi:hypothetical protein
MTDIDLFNERDWWQHPTSFEQLRRGDCEDFALWAWRKLVDIGVEAEFYVGRVQWGDETGLNRQHAWVVYRVSDADFLFEPAARSKQRMIRELSDAKGDYVPHFAVDRRLRTFAFGGCLLDRDRVERRRDPVARRPPACAASGRPQAHDKRGSVAAHQAPAESQASLREVLDPFAQRTDRTL